MKTKLVIKATRGIFEVINDNHMLHFIKYFLPFEVNLNFNNILKIQD